MSKVSPHFLLLLAAMLLAGCSANRSAIFRHQVITDESPSITVLDAKQRVILKGKPSLDNPVRFCAEPSPDVFSVVAQALSGGGTLGKGADPRTIEAALSAAFSSSEQGTNIARTQTINMLKEVMFRTCERYLNGGITELELPIQAARDQRLMVSILAIEQLTGAMGNKPVVIGASASGSAGASNEIAMTALSEAHKVLDTRHVVLKKKQDDLKALNGEAKDCETIAEAVQQKTEANLDQPLKEKRPKCEAATAAVGTAKAEHKEASDHYNVLVKSMNADGLPVNSGASLLAPVALGGIDASQERNLAAVSEAVTDIVRMNFNQDEFMFLCLKALSPGANVDGAAELQETCTKYINSTIALQAQQNFKAVAIQLAAATEFGEQEDARLFARFWKKVSEDGARPSLSRLAALRQSKPHFPACFDDSGSRESFFDCFVGQRAQMKRDLGE